MRRGPIRLIRLLCGGALEYIHRFVDRRLDEETEYSDTDGYKNDKQTAYAACDR